MSMLFLFAMHRLVMFLLKNKAKKIANILGWMNGSLLLHLLAELIWTHGIITVVENLAYKRRVEFNWLNMLRRLLKTDS